MDFDGFQACGFCAGFARVISYEISSGCHSCPVTFCFLRSLCADDSSVRNGSVGWDLVLSDEEDGVGAQNATFETLGKPAEFICTGDEPLVLVVGVRYEVPVLELAAGFEMRNSETFVDCCL